MTETLNILDLPYEVLSEIIRQIPGNHRSILESCKLFQEISYNVKFYTLSIQFDFYTNFCDLLDNDISFNFLLGVRRGYRHLYIKGSSNKNPTVLSRHQYERSMKIVEHFGRNVTYLSITNLMVPADFVNFLNLMPNLQRVHFRFVRFCEDDDLGIDIQLNLHKLNHLMIENDSRQHLHVLKIFKTLTAGVLQQLVISNYSNETLDANIKFFENQHNIEKLGIEGAFNYNLNFKQFKLKSLTLHSRHYLAEEPNDMKRIVKGQHEITTFFANSKIMRTGNLKIICNELSSLFHFKFHHSNQFQSSEYAHLSMLKKLSKLKMTFEEGPNEEINDCVSMVESESLTELYLDCGKTALTRATIAQLQINIPHLKQLRLLCQPSFEEFNFILLNFPNLQRLEYSYHNSYGFYLSTARKLELYVAGFKENNEEFAVCLSFLKSDTITELNLSCYTLIGSNLTEFATNLPQLKHLNVTSASLISELNLLIQHFPKLESCVYRNQKSDPYVFEDGLTNDKLKKLCLSFKGYDIVKLVACCKKLQDLAIDGVENAQFVRDILMARPNLKSFSIDIKKVMCTEFIEIIKDHGKNLRFFNCNFPLIRSDSYFSKINQMIMDVFRSQFKVINFSNHPYPKWIMNQ